ncbi:MAG: YceI family protein [Anaerolineales bacterium]|nr:YceI family protein [Anaerolineales bacterium]
MNRRILIGIGMITLLAATLVVAYLLRPPAEASAPIEAVPLATQVEAAAVVEAAKPDQDTTMENETEPEDPPTAPELTASTAGEAQAEEPPAGASLFAISQDESEVRFTLDELLRNVPVTVVGVSNQVAGEIAVDFDNPANSQVGVILINARTLQTDNSFRDRATQNEILDTGTYEFIRFTPTALSGLPASVTTGDTFSFQLSGDLEIRDLTNPVTFEVTLTVAAEDRLEGLGRATVLRSAYDLTIPDVPSVANVTDEVLLEIEFVALAK